MVRVPEDESDYKDAAFEAFNDRFPYAVALLDPDLTVQWVNEGFSRILGYPTGHIDGSHIVDVVHGDDLADVVPMALEVIDNASSALERPAAAAAAEISVRVRSYTGEWMPMCISGRVLDDDGRLVCVIRPAAERRALDMVIQELGKGSAGHSFDAIVELLRSQFSLKEAWMIHDIDGKVVVHGTSWDDQMGDPADLLKQLRDGCDGSSCQNEDRWLIPIPTASPNGLHGLLVMPAVRNGGPSPYDYYVMERTTTLAAVAFDRAEMDRILRLSATTDYLTGLLNRRAFEEHVDDLCDGPDCFPAGALFVDLDRFKAVNDSLGHHVGDAVLSAVASRIEHMTRDDDVVARVGGDEFVVLCRGLGSTELEATRQRLEDAVSQPIGLDNGRVSVSVSIGVSMAYSADDLKSLIRRSDQDMYERKSRNRRRAIEYSTND